MRLRPSIFLFTLIFDTMWAISIAGVLFWRIDAYRRTVAPGNPLPLDWIFKKQKGLLVLYSVLLIVSVTRITFGFLLTKSYDRMKAYGYNIPCVICLILGIILCAIYSDDTFKIQVQRGIFVDVTLKWEGALPIGIITILTNLIFLAIGSRVLQKGNVDNLV